ncbi:Purine nucleoside permease [Candidatus Sulfotelmatomonas gaucii]|uniref:Purine nucleoside permease n=1 Tax=Candidatus Sulfuritelmatomonas gaucii TaxID=2043161 RepID=A0A2N9LAK2_9BACT|nr:Purine nucleoside permease [Candidatus Sulfotelmatomonas gaucii]
MKSRTRVSLSVSLLVCFAATAAAKPRPIPVKVVVVAMFEAGADTGNQPGELQYWVERDHLDRVYPTPAGYHAVRMNGLGEMAVLTGPGTAHAAATIMAVGLDPRFDFSHAYWLIAGIAGGCPEQVSLGSAVWARWVVDGDLGYEIDAREIPPDWPTGYLPLRKKVPFEELAAPVDGQAYALNGGLTEWAFELTRGVALDDSDRLKEIRSNFDGAAAGRAPFVALGDEISSSTYWHGKLMDAWAAKWVPYFTGGKGTFATTAMEDTGTLQSIQFLARAGRVDANRVLVLRAVSNFDQQPRGLSAAESLAKQRIGAYAAYLPALEADYRVGHAVVNELLGHWARYVETIPEESRRGDEAPAR